ncbi:uncharacterized protein [Haliotis cracherodii]|uniref:uncharacterized protein n=1 Tax=Haliotis cracherodii TaxID=6455 RepID=UPI0039EBC846
MVMDVLRCCFLLGVFCIKGVFCVQCTAFESTFSSNIVTFTCPETCCTSAYSRKCCSIEPIHGWLIAMAIIIPLLVLCSCCGIIIAVIKSCTRTGNKGRVIAPLAPYTMPAPPAYSTYNATPPPYTNTQGVYISSNTTQLPPAVAFPPVGPTSGVPPASTTATSHPPPFSTTETSPAVGPTSGVPPASTTATSHPPPFSMTETSPVDQPTSGVPPASTIATSHQLPFSMTENVPSGSVPPAGTATT